MAEGYQVLEELGSTCQNILPTYAAADMHRWELWKGVQGHRQVNRRDRRHQTGRPARSAAQSIAHFLQIDLEDSTDELADIQAEISLLSTCKSPYVTEYRTSFVKGVKLWIVMEFLGGGSALDLVRIASISRTAIADASR